MQMDALPDSQCNAGALQRRKTFMRHSNGVDAHRNRRSSKGTSTAANKTALASRLLVTDQHTRVINSGVAGVYYIAGDTAAYQLCNGKRYCNKRWNNKRQR
jgi:hypothetical protein